MKCFTFAYETTTSMADIYTHKCSRYYIDSRGMRQYFTGKKGHNRVVYVKIMCYLNGYLVANELL